MSDDASVGTAGTAGTADQEEEEERAKWTSFLAQYTKLSRALHRSFDTEAQLVNKCRDLKTSLVDTATQLQVALATKKEDDLTITKLRLDAEKAWAKADMLQVREKSAQKLTITLQAVLPDPVVSLRRRM